MGIRTLACWSTYALIVSDVDLFIRHVYLYLFFKSKHNVMLWSCFILLFWRGITSLIVMKEKNRHSWLIVRNETHTVINIATAWMSNYLRYLRKRLACVWQWGDVRTVIVNTVKQRSNLQNSDFFMIFIVVPCILITSKFFLPTNAHFIIHIKC